jgi:hypothetical protein
MMSTLGSRSFFRLHRTRQPAWRAFAAPSLLFLAAGGLAGREMLVGRGSVGATGLVEQPCASVGPMAHGDEFRINFTATNRSDKSVRLYGVQGFCSDWGCVYGTSSFPLVIGPRASGTVTLIARSKGGSLPGAFNAEVALYSDAPGAERTALRVVGSVVARKGL